MSTSYVNPTIINLNEVEFIKDTLPTEFNLVYAPVDFCITNFGKLEEFAVRVSRYDGNRYINVDFESISLNTDFSGVSMLNGDASGLIAPHFYVSDTNRGIDPNNFLPDDVLLNSRFKNNNFHESFRTIRNPENLLKGVIFHIFVSTLFSNLSNIKSLDFTNSKVRKTGIFFVEDPTGNIVSNVFENTKDQMRGFSTDEDVYGYWFYKTINRKVEPNSSEYVPISQNDNLFIVYSIDLKLLQSNNSQVSNILSGLTQNNYSIKNVGLVDDIVEGSTVSRFILGWRLFPGLVNPPNYYDNSGNLLSGTMESVTDVILTNLSSKVVEINIPANVIDDTTNITSLEYNYRYSSTFEIDTSGNLIETNIIDISGEVNISDEKVNLEFKAGRSKINWIAIDEDGQGTQIIQYIFIRDYYAPQLSDQSNSFDLYIDSHKSIAVSNINNIGPVAIDNVDGELQRVFYEIYDKDNIKISSGVTIDKSVLSTEWDINRSPYKISWYAVDSAGNNSLNATYGSNSSETLVNIYDLYGPLFGNVNYSWIDYSSFSVNDVSLENPNNDLTFSVKIPTAFDAVYGWIKNFNYLLKDLSGNILSHNNNVSRTSDTNIERIDIITQIKNLPSSIEWSCEDLSGNSNENTGTTYLTIDRFSPVFVDADLNDINGYITTNSNSASVVIPVPNVNDDGAVINSINYSYSVGENTLSGSAVPGSNITKFFLHGSHFIKWTAVDNFGNESEKLQKIIVSDLYPPILSKYSEEIDLYINDNNDYVNFDLSGVQIPIASDNVDTSGIEIYYKILDTSGEELTTGVLNNSFFSNTISFYANKSPYKLLWYAIDSLGNSSLTSEYGNEYVTSIIVNDNYGPLFNNVEGNIVENITLNGTNTLTLVSPKLYDNIDGWLSVGSYNLLDSSGNNLISNENIILSNPGMENNYDVNIPIDLTNGEYPYNYKIEYNGFDNSGNSTRNSYNVNIVIQEPESYP